MHLYPRRLSAITAVRLPALPIAYEQTISHLLSSQDLARSFIHSCCSFLARGEPQAGCVRHGLFLLFLRACAAGNAYFDWLTCLLRNQLPALHRLGPLTFCHHPVSRCGVLLAVSLGSVAMPVQSSRRLTLEHVLFDQESDVLRNRSIHIRRALFKRHVGCRVNIDIEPVIVSHCARPKKYPAANHGCRVQRLHSQRPGRTLAGSCCGLLFGDQGAVRDGLQLVGSADRDRIAPPAYSLLRDPKRLGQLHLIAEVFDCLFCLHLVHQQ